LLHPKELALDVRANEELLVLQALDDTGGNISKAAAKLGVSRRTLHRKLSHMRAAEKARSEAAANLPQASPTTSNPTT
jgi:DNA-binding NtrC family response regulator